MNAAPHTMGEACARFCEFERALGLFGREVDGVRYWHLMRFHVYSTFVLPHLGHPLRPGTSSAPQSPHTSIARAENASHFPQCMHG